MSDWQRIGTVQVPAVRPVLTGTDDPPPCPACNGCGFVLPAVARAGAYEYHEPVPCPTCNAARIAEQRAERLIGQSGMQHLQHVSFESTTPRQGQQQAYAAARAFAEAPDGWLLLHGSYGVGKTRMAHCVANYRLSIGEQVLVRVTGALLNDLRATFDQDESKVTYHQRFKAICDCPLLVLDDYWDAKRSDWAIEQLYLLANERSTNRLPTMVTMNVNPRDIAPRIWSRMKEGALVTSYEMSVGTGL